jgi:hypothetical protein
MMIRMTMTLAAAALLAGCGLAETAATGAATGAGAAQQVKEGRETQQKVRDDIAAADQKAAEMRAAAEAAAEQ